MKKWHAWTSTALIATLGLAGPALAQDSGTDPRADPMAAEKFDVRAFVVLLSNDKEARERAFEVIEQSWEPSFVPMALEVGRFLRDPHYSSLLTRLVEKKTGQRFGRDLDAWWDWVWDREEEAHPQYAEFKAALYGLIDPKFRGYFSSRRAREIRLDEVRWGGVVQDGIPPLRGPKMISAAEAGYLEDDHVVFGLEVEGDARAYPKRILAWHEMFVDTVGGAPVAGVYCTLCGSMVLFETVHEGVEHALGTSGFLYRSNKLMFDQATQSLWNTLWGVPVIGPLVGKDITLKRRSVVTTTWGEWRRRHPDTTVLSLDTGFERDYGEGVAYREYFATDELMFTVPETDRRLKNKAEVLALVFPEDPAQSLAISSKFLNRKDIYHDELAGVEFVVLTDPSGAHRVYRSGGRKFSRWARDGSAVEDEAGTAWTLSEEGLENAEGEVLARLPAHRAFWFGWHAAYPETRLVR